MLPSSGTRLAHVGCMAAKSLADRVAALEAKLGTKSIEEQFREQAELIDRRFSQEFSEQAQLMDRRFSQEFSEQAQLIDRLFAYRFEELDKKWAPRFTSIERALGIILKKLG